MAVTVLAESRKEAAILVRKVKGTNIARAILFVRISSLASAVIDTGKRCNRRNSGKPHASGLGRTPN